jgi:hypothetical protein
MSPEFPDPQPSSVPVEQIRPGLTEILESIEMAVRVDRSRVTTIQLVRARLQLQSMLAGLPQ